MRAARATLWSALAVAATTWPWPERPGRVLGARDLEAGDHLWALWLGGQGGPVVATTTAVGFPEGYTWVVGDPLHVPIYAVGAALGGPGAGLGLVHAFALGLAALAAALWARELWPDRPDVAEVAAPLAVLAPELGGGLVTGMTEAQPMGLTALALLALYRQAVAPGGARAVVAAVTVGLLPWAGPYPALYGVLLAPIVLGVGLHGSTARGRAVAGLAAAGLGAAALASPVLLAILTARDPTLPGATSLTAQILAEPDLARNRMLGADLTGLLLPRGGGVHAGYLGVVATGLGVSAMARPDLRRWLPATLVAACGVLALGLFLQVEGEVVRVREAPLLMPAGGLSLLVDSLGRAPRWTRMAALGGVLLAPLAAAGIVGWSARLPPAVRVGARVAAVLLVVGDTLLLAPAPWPRPTFDPTPPPGLAALVGGPLLEVPRPRFATTLREVDGGPEMRLRHPTLVWQASLGLVYGANPHANGATPSPADRVADAWEGALLRGDAIAVGAARDEAATLGFRWLVLHEGLAGPSVQAAARATLGPPDVDTPRVHAWRLPARP